MKHIVKFEDVNQKAFEIDVSQLENLNLIATSANGFREITVWSVGWVDNTFHRSHQAMVDVKTFKIFVELLTEIKLGGSKEIKP